MKRVSMCSLAVVAVFPAVGMAQTEIPAMTVQNSHIDFGALPSGPTNLAAINAAGTSGGANIAALALPFKSSAAAGVYNTNPGYGNALGRLVGGGLGIIAPPEGAFDPFTADITLGMSSTQFGLTLGDWNGRATIEFFNGAMSLGTFTTTTSFSSPLIVVFVEAPFSFNRITVDAHGTLGNFVIPDLFVQIPAPTSLSLLALGGLALTRRRR